MPAIAEFVASGDDLAALVRAIEGVVATRLERAGSDRTSYLDTFDWRLRHAGLQLTDGTGALTLTPRDGAAVTTSMPAGGHIGGRLFAEQLPAPLRQRLGAVIEMRALLIVATVDSAEVVLRVLNDDGKTVARVHIERLHALLPDAPPVDFGLRVSVRALRGYDAAARRVAEQIGALPGLSTTTTTVLEAALAASGGGPGDYTSKFQVEIRRNEPPQVAVRRIHRHLMATMRRNEAGAIADLDSEFVHDFRVAVRRARSALKEIPGIFPAEFEHWLGAELRWLGGVTTPVRDLDVALLTFEDFRAMVGEQAADLEPLRGLLCEEKRSAHAELVDHLGSERYRALCEAWWAGISDPTVLGADAFPAYATIGELADARIRRVSRRVMRDGSAITDDSPAEALHDLRKRCKELRYLLEFFATLYDPAVIARLVKAMKSLQDNLGEFQDSQVQRESITAYAEQLLARGDVPAATFMAMGQVAEALRARQLRARVEFATRFATFSSRGTRGRFAALTGAPR